MVITGGSYTFRRGGPGPSHLRAGNPVEFRLVRAPNYGRREFSKNFSNQRSNFVLELRRGRKVFDKAKLERLIDECASRPDEFFVYASGFVAGKLFFRQWRDALDAVVFFWRRHLGGDHLLNPYVAINVFVQLEEEETVDKLKALFAVHVKSLVDGEAVKRWVKKIEAAGDEIENIKLQLKRKRSPQAAIQLPTKREGLVAERELMLRRVGEFKAAMFYILAHLGESGPDDCLEEGDGVEIFKFGSEFDWSRIYYVIMQECGQLEAGLPIYAYRQEILRDVHRQQAMVLVGETGSGKSTQIAQFLAYSGVVDGGSIVCTQPRKIACPMGL